jgi:hypothetical protein
VTGAISSLFGKPPPRPKTMYGYSGVGHRDLPDRAHVFKGVDGFENRARAIYTALARAQRERARITVSIMVVDVDDMLIEKLSVPRQKEDGNGATFSLELQRVRVVKSETVNAPMPAEARGAKKESKGTKAPMTLAEEVDAKKKKASLAYAARAKLRNLAANK